jgi:hypothetical protein
VSVEKLGKEGDFYERKGVNEYRLGEKFPRYAEFWAKYVFPYRDSSNLDHTKLRSDFPVPIEDICNSHYSVFFHLTLAYLQLDYLGKIPISQSVLDTGNPLYHLASAIDLCQGNRI